MVPRLICLCNNSCNCMLNMGTLNNGGRPNPHVLPHPPAKTGTPMIVGFKTADLSFLNTSSDISNNCTTTETLSVDYRIPGSSHLQPCIPWFGMVAVTAVP